MPWLVTRYAKLMEPGDGVLVWMAGKDAGIYAIAELIDSPTIRTEVPDIGYWVDASKIGQHPQVTIRFTDKLLETPLLRSNLINDPVLKSLIVIRQPNSTNFKVTPDEWKRVYELKSAA